MWRQLLVVLEHLPEGIYLYVTMPEGISFNLKVSTCMWSRPVHGPGRPRAGPGRAGLGRAGLKNWDDQTGRAGPGQIFDGPGRA